MVGLRSNESFEVAAKLYHCLDVEERSRNNCESSALSRADVAELADAYDLGSYGATYGGSIPSVRIIYVRIIFMA